jgi:HEAT repeat protein
MTRERDLVQLFGERRRELEALRGLTGGITATELRSAALPEAAFAATLEGLRDPNPRIRWWCIQLLDHVADPRAIDAVASMIEDPVPRVRRNAVHALGCAACKPGWAGGLPEAVTAKLSGLAARDANPKVRKQARLALAGGAAPARR